MSSIGRDVQGIKSEMDNVFDYVKQFDSNLKAMLEVNNTKGKTASKDKDNATGEDVAKRYSNAPPSVNMPLKTYIPVPFMLVFQICILLAGVSRAFPSAHLSLHVSVYNACMGTNTWESVFLRIAGGFLAAVVALLYYFVWYVWVGDVPFD
jgi:hypothetical protein